MLGRPFKKSRSLWLLLGVLFTGAVFCAIQYGGESTEDGQGAPLPERIDHFARRAASRQLVSGGEQEEEISIDRRVKMAAEIVDNGEVDVAADLLHEILEQEPNHVKALLEISLIELLDRGRPEMALPYLVRALRVDPSNDHLLGEVADIYVETGQFDEGLRFFSQLAEHFPHTAAISLRVGQIYYHKADYGKALSSLSSVERSAPHDGQARSLKARILLRLGDVDAAIKAYGKAEALLEGSIRGSMISGEPTDFLVQWLETMQIEMAEGLIEKDFFKLAEDILYKLSEKIPSDPEVIKLMDLAKAGRRGGAG